MQTLLSALAGIAIAAAAAPASGQRFRADGPDADAYGRRQGYPACTALTYLNEQRCRVGALSGFDTLFASRVVQAPAMPSALARAAAEPVVNYQHNGRTASLDDYLDRRPVSGFLIARDDTILVERYQYARTDKHRMASFSMSKTLTGLLVGIALGEGAIASLDDLAQVYAAGLQGTEYGRTPIRALLQMTSGVSFDEGNSGLQSDVYRLAVTALGPPGGEAAVKLFNSRYAAPGEKFAYSSADALVLGLVLAGAVKRPLAEYASDKLWKPLGAEADASWAVDSKGKEITYAYFNAVLRDWARLGLMLAHDGAWNGTQVVPRQWVLDSTIVQRASPFWSSLAPGAHTAGYGYQVWLNPTKRRTFQLRGLRGQFVLVDPASRLVLVQTAVRHSNDGEADAELMNMWRSLIGEQ
ncbi:MAG: serine hydrolase [Burkholderiales bacterium]|nr:serine hydrolase [Burkholderiales bacterium]